MATTYTIDILRQWITRLLILSVIIELIFYYKDDILLGCFALTYSWFVISKFVISYSNLRKYPLPVITLLAYGVSYCLLPLLITLMEGKPLTFNFQVPYDTFINQMINITVIVTAFKIATKLYRPSNLLNSILNKIGYMKKPNEIQIWLLGIIGFVFLILDVFGQGGERVYINTGNTINIIKDVLSTLAFAPLCLFFKELYGELKQVKTKKYVPYYLLLLMVVGIATTRRELMFGAVVSIGGIYLFSLLYKNKQIFSFKKGIFVLLLFYLVTGPLADFAMAMILSRQSVYSSSASDTFEKVMDLYNDKEALHKAYQFSLSVTDNGGNNQYGWSEYYVDNIFLDRFCNLRTIDGTLYNAQQCGYNSKEGQDYFENFWINELPSFIVNNCGLVKNFQGTATDHMVVHNFGKEYNLFGFKVGGETGIGLWMFGYSYYIIALFIYVITFYVLCSFINNSSVAILIPIPILITFRTYWMFFLNANGIFSTMGYTFTRSNINNIIIYCVLIFIITTISRLKCRNM